MILGFHEFVAMNFAFRCRRLAVVALALSLFAVASARSDEPTSRWETRIQRYLDQDRTQPPPTGGIVFTGSSSVDLWRTMRTDFPDLPVVNRGIGGSGLGDVLEFGPRLVFPLRPRMIVIYSGENDLDAGLTVDNVVDAFSQACAQIHREAPSARIVYMALKPSPKRRALLPAMREANTRIAALCAADPACTFVDVFTPMLDAQQEPRAELFGPDGLHLNAEGYRLWTELMGPVLRGAGSQ